MTRTIALATLTTLTTLTACATPQLLVSPSLGARPALTVERDAWSGAVSFGPYATRDLDRSWVHQQGFSLFGGSLGEAQQVVGFELARGGAPVWRGGCVNQVEEGGVRLGGLRIKNESASYQCELASEKLGRWTLRISRGSRAEDFSGTFTDGARTFAVRSSGETAGGYALPDALGFHVAERGQDAAAVQVMTPAQVWMAPSADDEADLLAGASTALLLYTRLQVR